MSDDSRPPKRPRTSDSPEQSEGAPQDYPSPLSESSNSDLARHEEVWFDDGNIVLVAGNTAFRVYRGLLAAQSTIFSDMLEASNPVDGETFEGCPVVRLSDSAQDLAHLLKTLLPKDNMSVGKNSPPLSPNGLFAVVRLAHKYGIVSVERRGLEMVRQQYSLDLTTWLKRSGFDFLPRVHAIGAINLARLTDTPSILPVAMLRCANRGGSIMEGWVREDGSVVHLSAEDLKRVIEGRDALARRGTQELLELLGGIPESDCFEPSSCRESLCYALATLDVDAVQGSANIFLGYQDVVDKLLVQAWCDICAQDIKEYASEQQKQMWSDLPKMFGLQIRHWPVLSPQLI